MRKNLDGKLFHIFLWLLCCRIHLQNDFFTALISRCRQSSPNSFIAAVRRCLEINQNPGQGVIAVVNDTGNNYSQVTTTPANSLLQVTLTRSCKYLPDKILKCPSGILRSPEKTDSLKNHKLKIPCQTPSSGRKRCG